MKIVKYDDSAHRKQAIDLLERVFGHAKDYNEPGLSIDRKIAVDDLFYVALEGDTVIGTIMTGYDGHRGWIYSVAVHQDFRRRGVGSRLLTHALEELAGLGCDKVNLQVLATNSEVQAFYAAHGFDVEERISMGKRLRVRS